MVCCSCSAVSENSCAIAGNDGKKVSSENGLNIDRNASNAASPSVGLGLG